MSNFNVVTPRKLPKRSKRRLGRIPDPIAYIDLTFSPYVQIAFDGSQNESSPTIDYNLHMNDLNSTFTVHNRRLQSKSNSSLNIKQCFLTPRAANIPSSSPKEQVKASPLSTRSPFTPENQVELRPLRTYRLQDVLRRKPVTPINYYKNPMKDD